MQSATPISDLNLHHLLLNSKTSQEESIDRVIQREDFKSLSEDKLVQLLNQVLLEVNDQEKPQFSQKIQKIALNSLKLFTGKDLYDEQNKTWRWEESKLISEQRKAVLDKMLEGESFSSKEEVVAQLNTIFPDYTTQKRFPLGLSIIGICLGLLLLAIPGIFYSKPKLVSAPKPQESSDPPPSSECPQGQNIVAIACKLPITDSDSTNFDQGKLIVKFKGTGSSDESILIHNNQDKKNVVLDNRTIGKYTGGVGNEPLEITFNKDADIKGVEAIINSLAYQNLSQNPPKGDRNLEIKLIEGDGKSSDPFTQTITIQKANKPPVLKIGNQNQTTEEDQEIAISGISVEDSDIGSDQIEMVLQVSNGILIVKNDVTDGLTVDDIGNNQTNEVYLLGTINQINNTLKADRSIIYQSNQDFNGNDSLTITALDSDKTVAGIEGKIVYPPKALDSKKDTEYIDITIKSVNDPPILGTQLTEEKAITLIQDWLENGKNEAFGSNYNKQIVSQYTTGKYQEKQLGKIDWLIENNTDDTHSSTTVTPVESLVVEGNQAKIDLQVRQYIERYQDNGYYRSPDYQNSGWSDGTFSFTLQKLGDDNWKIAEVEEI